MDMYINAETRAARKAMLAEIQKSDRTAISLMRAGFTRSQVQLGMPALIRAGKIFKHGTAQSTYYSVNRVKAAKEVRKLDPIVIPEAYPNFKLALRMGYTNIEPTAGRIIKGVLNQ